MISRNWSKLRDLLLALRPSIISKTILDRLFNPSSLRICSISTGSMVPLWSSSKRSKVALSSSQSVWLSLSRHEDGPLEAGAGPFPEAGVVLLFFNAIRYLQQIKVNYFAQIPSPYHDIQQYKTDMLPLQQQQLTLTTTPYTTHQKIHRIFRNYYSNPQWPFFLATYLVTIFLSVISLINIFTDGYHYYIGRILIFYLLYRYLSLALSNPGLALQNPISSEQQNMQRYSICTICNILVRKYTMHCHVCEACVEGFDHHCVFVGKCIGKNNIGEFKEFLCVVFFVMVYCIVVSVIQANQVIQKVGV